MKSNKKEYVFVLKFDYQLHDVICISFKSIFFNHFLIISIKFQENSKLDQFPNLNLNEIISLLLIEY